MHDTSLTPSLPLLLKCLLLRTAPVTGVAFVLSVALMSMPVSSQPGQKLEPLIEKGELSWFIDNQPLREVLQQLSKNIGFELTISPKLPAQKISGEFSSVPIDDALKTLLSTQNYIIGRSPQDEINHLYLFAEGESAKVAPRVNTSTGSTARTEKRKLIDKLEALLPAGTLTQAMKDALLAGSIPPSEAEIAEIRNRQSAIFEEFKAQFDSLNQTKAASEEH